MSCGWKQGLGWGEELSEKGSVKQTKESFARSLTVNMTLLVSPVKVTQVKVGLEYRRTREDFKGVQHLWTLFLKNLCIFSRNKATLDKVCNGSD